MTAATKPGHMDARMRARRARVRADAARRRQRRTLSLFVLLLVVAGVAVALRSPLFGISGIEVTGVSGSRAVTVERTAALEPGQHLLTAPLEEAQQRVEALPWVAEAIVRRSPPSTVAIEVTSRTPLLTVQTPGASWKVDGESVLVDGGRVRGAPVIAMGDVELPGLGRRIELDTVHDAVAVHTGVPSWLRSQIDGYEVSERYGLVLRLQVPAGRAGGGRSDGEDPAPPTEVRVRVGSAEDLPLKAEVIRVLLPQAVASGGSLDVRAPANPVVVPIS